MAGPRQQSKTLKATASKWYIYIYTYDSKVLPNKVGTMTLRVLFQSKETLTEQIVFCFSSS